MQTTQTDKNGKLTIKTIRNFIIDNELTENDTIILNSSNFDDIILEYRQTYNEGIILPFYLLRILIMEDFSTRVKLDRIKIVKNDPQRIFQDYISSSKKEIDFNDLSFNDRIIYRCDWCGNVVDADGSEFSNEFKKHKINILQKYEQELNVKRVQGKCCLDRLNE